MSDRVRVDVGPRVAIHIQATCYKLNCGFLLEWQPPDKGKFTKAYEHVRETGHTVIIDETRTQEIKLEVL